MTERDIIQIAAEKVAHFGIAAAAVAAGVSSSTLEKTIRTGRLPGHNAPARNISTFATLNRDAVSWEALKFVPR